MEGFLRQVERYGPLVARVLLAQVFVVSGFGKINAFAPTAALMGNLGLPLPQFLLGLTLALEIGGGLALALGWQARLLAAAFFLFTLAASVVVHPFWAAEPASFGGQLNNFMKNLAIMGGMLYVFVHGPGPLSLGRDEWLAPTAPPAKPKR